MTVCMNGISCCTSECQYHLSTLRPFSCTGQYSANVHCFCRVDPDSALYNDMASYKEKEGKDHILLSFTYKVWILLLSSTLFWLIRLMFSFFFFPHLQDSFPFEPPFVRVVQPIVSGGYVLGGGAICMELLTKQVSFMTLCISKGGHLSQSRHLYLMELTSSG